MSNSQDTNDVSIVEDDTDEALLDPAETGEEIQSDQDAPMDSDGSDNGEEDGDHQEIVLHNDSVAHFDMHRDSVFCIAQHPTHPEILATGGGDDVGFVFDSTPPEAPVLPASYQSGPPVTERSSLKPLAKLEGHTDSVTAVEFTVPRGEYVLSAGLDGRLRAYKDASTQNNGSSWTFVAEVQEVQEINWLASCPDPQYPNTVALGANDGSVYIYTVDVNDKASPLSIVQVFHLHTESCTAGSWTPDGKMLCTVSEDSSFYVWDVFGEVAAAGAAQAGKGGQSAVALTTQDQRFAVEGGLFSVAVSPTGAFAVVGGANGHIRVIGLPRISASQPKKPAGKGPASRNTSTSSSSQAGQILASLQAQQDSIETLAFSPSTSSLLAAGSVDGSIAVFDPSRNFALRRHIQNAHGEFAVVKVEFVRHLQAGGWVLTSAGMDGVLRRWDLRGGTTAAEQGLVKEWRGHRGDGEGGGILGFVQGEKGERIVTCGDDGVALVFDGRIA